MQPIERNPNNLLAARWGHAWKKMLRQFPDRTTTVAMLPDRGGARVQAMSAIGAQIVDQNLAANFLDQQVLGSGSRVMHF